MNEKRKNNSLSSLVQRNLCPLKIESTHEMRLTNTGLCLGLGTVATSATFSQLKTEREEEEREGKGQSGSRKTSERTSSGLYWLLTRET